MVSLENLLLYIPLAALLVMLPGPDFALIVRTSLTEGRSSGQAAACGVALGIMVHTSAAMLGISAVIAQSVTLFTLLRYAGAAYLFWMGIHALRAGREVTAAVVRHGGQEEEVQPVRGLRRRAFRQGFLTNALNPKAVVFFLTMLPQFLDPHAAGSRASSSSVSPSGWRWRRSRHQSPNPFPLRYPCTRSPCNVWPPSMTFPVSGVPR